MSNSTSRTFPAATELDSHAFPRLAPDAAGSQTLPAFGLPTPLDTASTSDALADLFLGGPRLAQAPSVEPKPDRSHRAPAHRLPTPQTSPAPAARSPRRRVNALVLGHLPIFAAAWVTPYARHLAERLSASVVTLRIRASDVTIDRVDPPGSRTPPAAPTSTVESAIAALGDTGTWLVVTDAPDEPALVEAPGVTDVTLLTGADETAVIAAYRTLKGLAPIINASPDADRAPVLRIAVITSDAAAAQAASDKLARAAATFLDTPIQIETVLAKVGARAGSSVYRGPSGTDLPGLMRAIVEQSPAPTSSPAPAPPAATTHAAPANSQRPSPAPAPSTSPATPEASTLPTGDHLVALLGLSLLHFDCPYAPAIALATDRANRLHLVTLAHAAGAGDACRSLAVASAWAASHRSLISAAGVSLAADASPVSHLVTMSAPAAISLAHTELVLHLLIDAGPTAPSRWLLRPLNRAN